MKKRMTRRLFLGSALGAAAMALMPRLALAEPLVTTNLFKKKGTDFPYKLTDQQWRDKLGPEAYEVMRLNENETSGTSPLLRERRKGTYLCRGCEAPVFASSAKVMTNDYPTFRQPLNLKVIRTSTDFGILLPRTEVHCANCGGHLGFRMPVDGEGAETWRYPLNGTSLVFQPA